MRVYYIFNECDYIIVVCTYIWWCENNENRSEMDKIKSKRVNLNTGIYKYTYASKENESNYITLWKLPFSINWLIDIVCNICFNVTNIIYE